MSKFIRYLLFTGIPLAGLFLVWLGFQDKDKTAGLNNDPPPGLQEPVEGPKRDDQIDTTEILLSALNMAPIQTLENEVYLLTAFDRLDEKTLVFVGNYAHKNEVRFFDLETNRIVATLNLDELPLDIYCQKDTCYLLTEKSILAIYDRQIAWFVRHEISGVFTFDRLLSLDGRIYVSMSDGSAFRIGKKAIKKLDKLYLDGYPVWIQKASPYAFSIEMANGSLQYASTQPLGSMTILGEGDDQLICIVEKVIHQQPLKVQRTITSSADGFKEELQNVDMQPYAFLKNDLRLHGDTVYHLILHNDRVSLVAESLEK